MKQGHKPKRSPRAKKELIIMHILSHGCACIGHLASLLLKQITVSCFHGVIGIIPLNAEPAIARQILHLAKHIPILPEAFIPCDISSA